MRLATWVARDGSGPGGGVLAAPTSGVVVGAPGEEVLHALRGATTTTDLLEAGAAGREEAAAWAVANSPAVALASVRLLPPVRPASVRDFVTFEEHVEGVVRSVGGAPGAAAPVVADAWYDAPAFYFTNPHGLVGAHDDVAVPPGCGVLDFELEVAAVLGAGGRDLSVADARAAIVGYCLFNDWSARDLQGREMQVGLGPAKGKDSATTLGPWLVTADELEGARDDEGFLALSLTASVNGARVGGDLLSHASWTFEEMVAYASRGALVAPGDVLASGTCGGGGCLAERWGRAGERVPRPLAPGDVVRLEADGLGSTANRVVAGRALADVPAVPRARRRGGRGER